MANGNLPRRIIKETQRLLSEPAPGISASPSEDNMRYFNVMILGPTQSPYEAQLQKLDLSSNYLRGEIPTKLGRLASLFDLKLNDNKLSGNIPQVFGKLSNLENLNLAANNLSGPIPIELVRNTTDEPRQVHNQNLFAIWSYDGKMVYENIIEATENFSTKHWVGEGGCGTVYRADLPSGQVVAVKKLHESPDGDLTNLQSFMSEIRALIEIRHQNIVKLYGYCSHPRHLFLVYEFLEGGSSGNMLSTKDQVLQFDWIKRVNVAKGVANALSYMHHNCSPPIIHRDISSKNALLDLEYVAHISDFGTAKFLKLDSSNWTSFAQTYGYAAAPELAYIMEVNERCDVYSFGVHTLELIMGKHLGDLISSLSSLSSFSSSTSTVHGILLKDVLDQRLLPPKNQVAEQVVMVVKLSFACLQTNPLSRPSMRQVAMKLSDDHVTMKISDDQSPPL
ncbi:unnamed protein product [Camellia sinensis]